MALSFIRVNQSNTAYRKSDPITKIKIQLIENGLEIERAITKAERRRILDAADMLPIIGGRFKDRKRFNGKQRTIRKGYRPYGNRATIYALIETGMRRAAIFKLNIDKY